MIHRHCFEAFNRTLQDILKSCKLFGGKVVTVIGNFRQILPVIQKGTKHDIMYATSNSFPLW